MNINWVSPCVAAQRFNQRPVSGNDDVNKPLTHPLTSLTWGSPGQTLAKWGKLTGKNNSWWSGAAPASYFSIIFKRWPYFHIHGYVFKIFNRRRRGVKSDQIQILHANPWCKLVLMSGCRQCFLCRKFLFWKLIKFDLSLTLNRAGYVSMPYYRPGISCILEFVKKRDLLIPF